MEYQLICIAPDGEFVTEGFFETEDEALERAGDLGSRWIFYPLTALVVDKIIVDAGDDFKWLEGTNIKDLKSLGKELSLEMEAIYG